MKTNALGRWIATVISVALTSWILSGCASKPKVDWNSRVGTYTFDDAVREMGPPDRSTKLSDGSTVAEWYRGRRPSMSFGVGMGSYGHGGGVGVGQSVGTGGDAIFTRLTFGPEGGLREYGTSER
jgi:hypothetical protein